MHIKFLNTGKGSARSAQQYLLQEFDNKGEMRESVVLLRGNPTQVTELATSLSFKHKYTSAVIAWHKHDNPTDAQIDSVLDDFERLAFAGLESNQYTYYAVWHGESDGSGHIHIISPRVELQSGKSMNIAPPGTLKVYDSLTHMHNLQNEWKSPRARTSVLERDSIMIHADTTQNEAKKMITNHLAARIEKGTISNRADIVAYLSSIGKITREGKDYVSVQPKGFKKAIRLKGAIYGREFKATSTKTRSNERGSSVARERELQETSGLFESYCQSRTRYNLERYPAIQKDNPNDASRKRSEREVERRKHQKKERESSIKSGRDADESRRRSRDSAREINQRNPSNANDNQERSREQDREIQTDDVLHSRDIHNGSSHGRDTLRRSQKRITDDRIREAIEQIAIDARKRLQNRTREDIDTTQRRIEECLYRIRIADENSFGSARTARDEAQSRDEEYRQQLRIADEQSLASIGTTSRAVERIRESVHELANQHQRRATTKIADFFASGIRIVSRGYQRGSQIVAEIRRRYLDGDIGTERGSERIKRITRELRGSTQQTTEIIEKRVSTAISKKIKQRYDRDNDFDYGMSM